ncbi:hypothetical protein K440DRAFT_523786, partial [Wilcoxina mikolae CBS 423.85]
TPKPTAASAIQDLTSIDSDITRLLSSASEAIRCLTTPSSSSGAEETFTHHAATYHQLLSSITVRLRRQILQLQAAEIPVSGIDVGALNSRNDVVGREMEAECWASARAFIEGLEKRGEEGEGE